MRPLVEADQPERLRRQISKLPCQTAAGVDCQSRSSVGAVVTAGQRPRAGRHEPEHQSSRGWRINRRTDQHRSPASAEAKGLSDFARTIGRGTLQRARIVSSHVYGIAVSRPPSDHPSRGTYTLRLGNRQSRAPGYRSRSGCDGCAPLRESAGESCAADGGNSCRGGRPTNRTGCDLCASVAVTQQSGELLVGAHNHGGVRRRNRD